MEDTGLIKKKILIIFLVLCMLRSGFNYLGNPPNVSDLTGKTITLKFFENEFVLKLEEFCIINTENIGTVANEDYLQQKINEISLNINRNAIAAKIIDQKEFSIENETDGYKVDEIQLLQNIKDYLETGNIVDNYIIDIPAEVIKPQLTQEILTKIVNTELSSFTTKFNPSQKDRTENLRISTAELNGTVVYPGEIFSMDKKLGERTTLKGYKYAPIFSGGKVIKGLAGGICQTTTTTYNAALLANLQILERYRHSLPVTYIGKGLDAAISSNVQDLKFKNTTEYPIYLKAYIDNKKGLLTVKIYGYKKDFIVKIQTEQQVKNKRTYYMTYRQISDLNNNIEKKELVSIDIF